MDAFTANKELNNREIERNAAVVLSKPLKLSVAMTNRCNIRCIMCARVGAGEEYTLPREYAERLFPLFPYLEDIDMQGGEVFLVEYYKSFFRALNEYPHVHKRVITNGLLIDEEWADILAQAKNLELTFSIDAATPATYEKIRRGASFPVLLKSIGLANRARARGGGAIELSINAAVMRSNYGELVKFPAFCREHSFQGIRFDFLHPENCPEEDIFFNRDESAAAFLRETMPSVEKECREAGVAFSYTFGSLISPPPEPAVRQNAARTMPRCKLPWKKLFVDLRGVIYPDCLCRHKIGVIAEPVENAWNGERMQEYRRRIAEGRVEGWCSGICVANAVSPRQLE